MELVSMKQAKVDNEAASASPDSDYPYGLCIELCDDQLKALGIDKLPEVDAEMELEARVIVRRKSETADKEGTDKQISLQITHMALAGDTTSKEAKALYGETLLTGHE